MKDNPIIGVTDSGIGGLSVFAELKKRIPYTDYVYISDNAYCPYGHRSKPEIIERMVRITDFLLIRGVSMIVVACNTATAAAIDYLRERYEIPFVGIEPAVKPAALNSKSGVIGILATKGTLSGELYHRTLERYGMGVEVIEQVGDGLVELVERGDIDSVKTDLLLRKYIEPMLARGADHIVLGCTHYPFLIDAIRKVVGEDVVIVNPAPAVAKQAEKVFAELNAINHYKQRDDVEDFFYSTGGYKKNMPVNLQIGKFTDIQL